MSRYRTEIHIPADRYIALQLPAHLPEGRAFVTVQVDEPGPDEPAEADRQDIEWWDEFGEDEDDAPKGLAGGSPP